MKIFKVVIMAVAALSVSAIAMAQERQMTRAEYVEKYKPIAIAHMKRFGIPASITMAQGILESGAGNSDLARRSNNHFGIKCKKDWTGAKVYHDDDAKGECFRAYATVEESFEDHAKFLDDSPRYDSLFAYPSNDYRSWARGLKACGYATAPDYADRLIKIIENMKLYLLDQEGDATTATAATTTAASSAVTTTVAAPAAENNETATKPAEEKKAESPKPAEQKEPEKKEAPKQESQPEQKPQQVQAPQQEKKAEPQPVVKEEATKPAESTMKVAATPKNSVAASDEQVNPNNYRVTVNSYNGYGVYRSNYVSYVVAKEGDTFESIAKIFEISPSMLRRFNDVSKSAKLTKGSIVYIERKQTHWFGSEMQHTVARNQNIYSISQLYGIRLKSLIKMNKINEGEDVRPGDIVRLQ